MALARSGLAGFGSSQAGRERVRGDGLGVVGGGSLTGFDADALQAVKPGLPAIGSLVSPLFDSVAGNFSCSRPAKDVRADALRDVIRKIEGHARFAPASPLPSVQAEDRAEDRAEDLSAPVWSFGCAALDQRLPRGLECDGVHEVKAAAHLSGASAGDWMAGLGFALRLAVRRREMLRPSASARRRGLWMLWCTTRAFAAEYGRLSAQGLLQLGIDPADVLIVEAMREDEALQALEDGLRSKSLGLVCGVLDDVALTPARRLSLAARSSETPCLLITHPSSPPAAATATRFTVSRPRSALHPLDLRAPGNMRFAVRLDRCRAAPRASGKRSLLLEWCDEAHSFNLAAGVAHCAPQAGGSLRRANG